MMKNKKVKNFVVKCKEIISNVTDDEIMNIRNKVKSKMTNLGQK